MSVGVDIGLIELPGFQAPGCAFAEMSDGINGVCRGVS